MHSPSERGSRPPFGNPLSTFACRPLRDSRACRPVLAENRPLACFPGAANPGRQRREERIFAPQVKPAPQKFILAPYMPLLRIGHEGAAPLQTTPGIVDFQTLIIENLFIQFLFPVNTDFHLEHVQMWDGFCVRSRKASESVPVGTHPAAPSGR